MIPNRDNPFSKLCSFTLGVICSFGVGLYPSDAKDTTNSNAAIASDWRVISSTQPLALGYEAFLVKKTVSGSHQLELNLVYFDSNHCTIKAVDQSSREEGKDPPNIAKLHHNTLAVCNAGYFTPEFEPLGLVISYKNRIGSFQRSSLLGGFIQVKKERPMLLWRDEYANESDVTDLIQAGPRLVSGGRSIKGLQSDSIRPRTFIFTDNNGKWAIGTCYYSSLQQLAEILANKNIITEMEIDRALNLDGGRSTCMWWKNHQTEESGYLPTYRVVRNFLLVVPKSP